MPEVQVQAFAAAQADGAFVLDVREPHEYLTGHVPGAALIPVGEVPARVRDLPRGERIYVICASGNRSRATPDLLTRHGFDAHSVQGGTGEWVRSGRPVVVGPRPNAA